MPPASDDAAAARQAESPLLQHSAPVPTDRAWITGAGSDCNVYVADGDGHRRWPGVLPHGALRRTRRFCRGPAPAHRGEQGGRLGQALFRSATQPCPRLAGTAASRADGRRGHARADDRPFGGRRGPH